MIVPWSNSRPEAARYFDRAEAELARGAREVPGYRVTFRNFSFSLTFTPCMSRKLPAKLKL